jgi:DNA-binding transcriptional ArsR family regulator
MGHPLRGELLALLRTRGTVTSTEAARELGESSGACSFHLRQLERYGLIEEVPGRQGRARPWRLVSARAERSGGSADEFGALARELENEGYRRWLAGRETAPPGWRDEAFSTVLYLTPAQLAEVAAAIRSVIASFEMEANTAQSAEVLPVGVVARVFPLLPAGSDG